MPRPAPTTGRTLVTLRPGTSADEVAVLLGEPAEPGGGGDADRRADHVCVCFERLGVAVVPTGHAEHRLRALLADPTSPVRALEPERAVSVVPALRSPSPPTTPDLARQAPTGPPWQDTAEDAWSRHSVAAVGSALTGADIAVAVLDTGIDPRHPDLRDAVQALRSFVDTDPSDRHGHGTHVAGTVAAGRPAGVPAYGIAPGARLHVGKVLGDDGTGTDTGVLDGIDWALEQGCRLVSLSLGSPWQGPGHPIAYEQAAQAAIAAGSLLIAAVGNDSVRPGILRPVNTPANAPSILAVGAVDRRDRVADFSNPSLPGRGSVDLAAPGVAILSAVPGDGHARFDGTSMATPHVTGVAALLLEDDPARGAWEVAARLHLGARRIREPSRDVGGGVARVTVTAAAADPSAADPSASADRPR